VFRLIVGVCSFTYSQRDRIRALSQFYEEKGYRQCQYHIRAPRNSVINLNFTRFIGFRSRTSMTTSTRQSVGSHDTEVSSLCSLPELVVSEKDSADENVARRVVKICRSSQNVQLPKVFQTQFNVVEITYTWVENHSSGFTLDFDFHLFNCKYILFCFKCVYIIGKRNLK